MTIKTRRRLRVTGGLLIIVLLIVWLLGHLNQYVNTPAVHDEIMRAISKPYNGKIKAGLLDGDIWAFAAQGWDVSAETDRGEYIGKSPHIKIWFNPLSFFWRQVRPERVEMDKPVVHLWTDPDHTFIFKRWKRPPRRLVPIFRVRAGTLIAQDGTFTYDYFPQPRPLHVYLEGINARAIFSDKIPYIQGTVNRLYLKYDFFDDWFYNLTVQGIIGEEFVDAHRVTATYLNLPFMISGRLDDTRRKNPRLNLHVMTYGKIGDLLRYFHYEKMPPGEFTLDAMVTGMSDDFYINGNFASSYGIVEKQRYDDLKVKFVYHQHVVNVEKFTARMYGMSWEGSGWYNLQTGEFQAHGVMIRKGRAVRFDARGRLDREHQTMIFTSLILDGGSSKITASGRWFVSKGTISFNYRLAVNDVAREMNYWGQKNFAGKLDVSGDLSGSIKNPQLTADGQMSNFEWRRAFFGTGPFSATIKDGDLSVKYDINEKGFWLQSAAHVPVLRNGDTVSLKRLPFSFQIKVKGMSITKKLMGTSFTGKASGELAGEGTTDNLHATGNIELRNIDAWGQSIQKMDARLDMTGKGIGFEDMAVLLPSGDTGHGRIWTDWDLNYVLALDSDLIRLSSLDKVKSSKLPVEGNATLSANGKGNFDRVQINALVDFSTLKYSTLDLKGGKLSIFLDGTTANLQGNFYSGTTVNGAYDFNDGTFRNFVVAFNNAPLEPILTWRGIEHASGTMTGSATLNGGAKGWGDVDYRLLLSALELRVQQETIRNNGPIQMEYGPSGGKEDIHLLVKGGKLDITGTVSAEEVWDLALVGNFDLGLLQAFSPRIRSASGGANLNASLRGSSEKILIGGYLELVDGDIRFRGYSSDFSSVSGRLVFYPDRLSIEKLAGIINEEGDFSANGEVYYEGLHFTAFNLKLNATNLPYSKPGEYRVVLSPSFTLTGTMDEPALSGEVQIVEGRYTKDVRIDKQFVGIQRETAPRKESTGFMSALKLRIHVKDEGNFRVRNNIADLYLRSDLSIRGTAVYPTLEGLVEGTEGKIFYGGTAFTLVRAKIDFNNPANLDPYVDVLARTEIRTYEIQLSLVGPLSHMLLTLDSTPQLDNENILSLLTFRLLTDELTQNQAQTLLAIPMFFGRQLAGTVAAPLEKYTGIDLGSVETRGNDSSSGSSVVISGRINRRTEIQYSAETTGPNKIRETQVIYRITDNLWLQGTQNNLGVYSFKLNLHFEGR